MEPLTDLSPMPFGKYVNILMQDVPTSYLHWLWESFKKNPNRADLKTNRVIDYIQTNLSALKQEDEDLIWSR